RTGTRSFANCRISHALRGAGSWSNAPNIERCCFPDISALPMLLEFGRRLQVSPCSSSSPTCVEGISSILDTDHPRRRAVHALEVERQGNQGEAWADAAEPGEHLDHGNSRLEPPLVVGAALSRAQRHQPERLLREAIHGDGRYAALLHPFTDAWLQMNGIGPEFRLAEGAVGPQGLDHGDLAWRWAHPGPFEIVGVHAL